MRLFWVIVLFAFFSTPAPALTEDEIQGYLNDAIEAGGGEVVIPPGVHLLKKGLAIRDAKKVRLIGLEADRCVLKLPPIAYARVKGETPKGADHLITAGMQHVVPRMRLRIEVPGERASPQLAFVDSIEGDTIKISAPLPFAIPAGTLLRDDNAPNAIEITGACENITLEKLCIDGGRVATDPAFHTQSLACGVMVKGAYHPEKDPEGIRIQNVKVLRCIIQNHHGRGAAFYATGGGGLEDCTLMDLSAAAVDLNAFSEKITVRHNHMARCLVGVDLTDTRDCIITANEIRQCGSGFSLRRICNLSTWNEGNQMLDNLIDQTRGNAIQVGAQTARTLIEHNEIRNAGKNGIVISGENQTVESNTFFGTAIQDIVRDP